MLSMYDECYNQATYSRVIKCYVEHFAVGLNDQKARHLMQFFNNAISNYTSELNPIPICIEDLNNMIAYVTGNFLQQSENTFEPEQSMDSTGAPTLAQIDIDILSLRLLNMCLEKALKRHEADWTLCRSTRDPQLYKIEGVDIQNFTIEFDCSIKNVIALLETALKAIVSRSDELKRTSMEEIDKSIRLNEVKSWSAVNEAAFAETQVWNDEIVAIIHDTLKLMKAMKEINENYSCCERIEEFDKISKNLMASLIVIEKQPPEVLQTSKNFSTTIRILLTLSKFKEISKRPVKIMFGDVSIWSYYNDSTANLNQSEIQLPRDKILTKIEKSEHEHDICYLFDKLKVKQVVRTKTEQETEKKSVIEHKFALVYRIKLIVDDKEYTASARTWPVLIIVHQSQEAIANAIRMWDKHFPKIVRSEIASIPWNQTRALLKSFFKTKTGFELNSEQLLALYEKLDREKIIIDNEFIWASSINQLKRTFSFWDWFFSTMKLILNHIEKLWTDGLIDGFVRQSYLKRFPVGSFALRFSESVIGGLIIMYVEYNFKTGGNEVIQLEPILIEGSQIKNHPSKEPANIVIVDIIRDLKECKHLCNGKLKDVAFGGFYKKPSKNKDPKYQSINTSYGVNSNISTQGIDPQTPPNEPLLQFSMETEAVENASTSMSNFDVEYSSSNLFMRNSPVPNHQANVFSAEDEDFLGDFRAFL